MDTAKQGENTNGDSLALVRQNALGAEAIPRPAPIETTLQDIADESRSVDANSPTFLGDPATGGQVSSVCTDGCCPR